MDDPNLILLFFKILVIALRESSNNDSTAKCCENINTH